MIRVLATITVKPGKVQEFLDVFKANVPNVLNEKGCLEYQPMIDFPSGLDAQEVDDHLVTIVEKWESFEALQAHFVEPHMKTYKEKVDEKDLVENVALTILQDA